MKQPVIAVTKGIDIVPPSRDEPRAEREIHGAIRDPCAAGGRGTCPCASGDVKREKVNAGARI
ncbi:hypothetical protein OVY01_12685 [Robbsia sp. Bb-Pol-6]|uniref:Uncharacterized protein n=1 Tax=Robbsia betulipollinis TaxID=2981849 RepID=A0ABT3ZNP4_9BURK|nr:hypothetical protein [Robbsia betulipollinis]MCY0388077.1 hypothetical protein [Robbsia betulipollinis]